MDCEYHIHETATVDDGVSIGAGTKIWHYSHLCSGAQIGEYCNLGQNTFVADNVKIGHNVKIQNNVSLYSGVTLEDDVFVGPSCVFTNISNPRSQVVRRGVYEKTLVKRGATLGANATIVCGISIGHYAFVAAGAVVTKDVSDYADMRGVPAQQVGWMSRHGHPLRDRDEEGYFVCPESKFRYEVTAGDKLRCLDLGETESLPQELAIGSVSYQEIKKSNDKAS